MSQTIPQRLISQAELWVGYLEKKSNNNLDDYTANAGKANYTRFNRDYKQYMNSGTLNMQWCASFVSCMFVYEFGLEIAKILLCKNLHCYTPTGVNYFKQAGLYTKRSKADPQPGDVVFFFSTSKGRVGHVGIVTRVTDTHIYTIEGNTSNSGILVTNGGCVAAKSYKKTSTYIDGYGRPPYYMVPELEGNLSAPIPNSDLTRVLKKGSMGEDVRELQTILISWNYDLGSYGADGDFGSKTESAVRNFQRANGLVDTGVYGPMTHETLKALIKMEIETPVMNDDGIESEPSEDSTDGPIEEELEDEPDATGDEDPAKDYEHYILVTGGTVNVRTQPNTAGSVVFVAKKNDELAYSGVTTLDGWLGVVCEGVLCWISGKYAVLKEVEVEDDEPLTGDVETPGEEIVDDRAIIDISHYQTIKDAKLMAKYVKLVIHRASVGSNLDKKFVKHAKMMRDAGIPYGTYHYIKATNANEAITEARHFYKAASPENPLFYAADMEWTGIAKGRARDICDAFLDELQRLGVKRNAIYVGHHLYKLWNLNYARTNFVWIPRYGNKKTNLAGKPGKWPAYPCTLHQYSSGGSIPGIVGRVDMNRLTGKGLTFAQLVERG